MELVQELLPQPSHEQCQRIYNTFNPIEYEKNLQVLKQWFEERTHIQCDENYENQLNIFLRGSKNDLAKAKKRLKNFFVYKTKFPDFYCYYDLSGKYEEFSGFYILCQPGVTADGYRVIFLGLRTASIEDFDADIMFKSLFMTDHLGMCLAPQFLLGVIVVFDMANASTKHALKILTWRFRRYAQITNEVMPFRLRKLYMINVPPYIEKFVNIGRSFLSEKLRSRFHIEQSDNEMRKNVPKHVLPADYGGDAECVRVQTEKWFKLITALRPWYEAEQKVLLHASRSNKDCAKNAQTTGATAITSGSDDLTDTNKLTNSFAHLEID